MLSCDEESTKINYRLLFKKCPFTPILMSYLDPLPGFPEWHTSLIVELTLLCVLISAVRPQLSGI